MQYTTYSAGGVTSPPFYRRACDHALQALKADTDKKIKAIAVVHNETATGVTSDLPKIRETIDACGHPALFMVDGVSSIGALDFQMDKWKVDIAVTGSQKALSLPTGLAVVAVSDKVTSLPGHTYHILPPPFQPPPPLPTHCPFQRSSLLSSVSTDSCCSCGYP